MEVVVNFSRIVALSILIIIISSVAAAEGIGPNYIGIKAYMNPGLYVGLLYERNGFFSLSSRRIGVHGLHVEAGVGEPFNTTEDDPPYEPQASIAYKFGMVLQQGTIWERSDGSRYLDVYSYSTAYVFAGLTEEFSLLSTDPEKSDKTYFKIGFGFDALRQLIGFEIYHCTDPLGSVLTEDESSGGIGVAAWIGFSF